MDENELNPVVSFLTHHWWASWGGVIAINTVGSFYEGFVGFILLLAAILIWSHIYSRSNRIHGRNLCLRCIKDVPSNPQAEIDQNKRSLKLVHKIASKPYIVLFLVSLWLGWSISITYLEMWLGFSDSTRKLLSALVTFSPILFFDRSNSIHNRLQPWCPYCRKGGGGGESVPEVTPTPDPAGSKTV